MGNGYISKLRVFLDGEVTSPVAQQKEFACNAGDVGSVSELGKSPGGGHGNPLQYSCWDNPMDGGAWQATGCGVAKSWT